VNPRHLLKVRVGRLLLLLACGLAMSCGTAWLAALLPAWDSEELRRFTHPWADGRRSRSEAMPATLMSVGRSAGVTEGWYWEGAWRVGSVRVSAVPAPERPSPAGYDPPAWFKELRQPAALRPDALSASPSVVLRTGFGLPLPCLGMSADLPTRDAPPVDWTWSGSLQLAAPPDWSGARPSSVLATRTHGMGRLPLEPMWGGLAVNTLAWSAVLLAAIGVRRLCTWLPRALRHDAGQCTSCGYALGHHRGPTCPECGTARGRPLRERDLARGLAVASVLALALAVWMAFDLGGVRQARLNRDDVALVLLRLSYHWPTPVVLAAASLAAMAAWAGAAVIRMRAASRREWPIAVAEACMALAAVACMAWCGVRAVEAVHRDNLVLGAVCVVAAVGLALAGGALLRTPRGGGALLVRAAALAASAASAAAALWATLTATDFSTMMGIGTVDWLRYAPVVAMLAAVCAGVGTTAALAQAYHPRS
jgi:predicted RNA-binding Zn-ribbon protein involved in translation (DUF1610 family)